MLRTAMIGLGWWGRVMVNSIKDSQDLVINRLAARNPDKHRDFEKETGIPLLDSFEDVLKDPEVDAVVICTPHSQHEEQFFAALEAGKQIFCEKPLSLTKESAQRMVQAAADAGLVMGLGHERRFESTMEEIARLVKSGELGTELHAESNFSHNIFAAVEEDGWRGSTEEAPAAGMTGMGVHLTDLYISMFGPIKRLIAQTARRVLKLPTGDIVNVQMQFESGATAFIAAISATPYYGRFTVFGDKMWAEARDDAHPEKGGTTHLVTCGLDGVQHTKTFDPKNAVRANLEAWARAVQGKEEYRFTNEQKIQNVAVLEAIARSVKSGNWEDV